MAGAAERLLVLGLDPGSRATGYGLVQSQGSRLKLVDAGVIRPPAKAGLAQRLAAIYEGVAKVIAANGPQQAAVEGVFTAKNARSAMVLGQARGAAILAPALAGIAVFEYPPTTVKKSLVGVGRAGKEQVRAMVAALLKAPLPGGLDASDALAVAICHLHSRNLSARGLL